HELWQSRYGSDPQIVNRDIQLDGDKYTVVGVMPGGFQFFESDVRLWVPLALDAEELANRGNHYLKVVARMKPGVTVKEAQADVSAVTARIAKDHPDAMFNGKVGAVVMPLRQEYTGDVRGSLFVLLVAVAFVLLIACANVAGLLLARAV